MSTYSLQQITSEDELILGVLSSPVNKSPDSPHKLSIRPITIKEKLFYQCSALTKEQVKHHNIASQDLRDTLQKLLMTEYRQAVLYCKRGDYYIVINKKLEMSIKKKAPTKVLVNTSHNLPKEYILREGKPIPFLVHLGIMTPEGKVTAKMRDKFRQINRFVEMITDIVSHIKKEDKIHIIDYGCGKAYLTFALYHYLKFVEGLDIHVTGLDLKKEVIADCQKLAAELEYNTLHFMVGDINQHQALEKVDMVVSLHACDTATDAALEKAVRWKAKVILAVPCCQHELMTQIKSTPLNPLLQHGILKERFAALATDAARAQLLELLGYRTQVIEFIDMEHTPKNILIRAVFQKEVKNIKRKIADYCAFKNALQITPSLEKRFEQELQAIPK